MKYYVTFLGLCAPWSKFETLKEARKYLNNCKKEDKKESKWKLKDEYQYSKNSYRLVFGCNLYSAGSIHKI